MKRHYYIYNGEPWNDELEDWWLAIEGQYQTHMVKLHGAGVLEGLPVSENDPTPDMSVLVGAGYAWDGYGKIIHPTATEARDCSVDKNAAPTIPSAGKERYIVIAAKHDRKLSGLSTSIVGWPEAASEEVYTIDDDWYEYVVIAGAEADPGSATVPACQVDEVHLAAVLLTDSTTAITDAMIDTSGRPAITNPADAIAEHVAADPAHAAEKISYDDSTTKTGAGNVQQALDHLQTIYTDTGAADALVITPSPAITSYAAGQVFRVKVANTNTGACTININSKGAKAIKTPAGGDLVAGDLHAGAVATLVYDGTNFQATTISGRSYWRSAATTVVTESTATAWTTVDVSSYIRTGDRIAILALETVTNTVQVWLRHPSGAEMWISPSTVSSTWGLQMEVGLNADAEFQFKVNTSGGGGSLNIHLLGSRP